MNKIKHRNVFVLLFSVFDITMFAAILSHFLQLLPQLSFSLSSIDCYSSVYLSVGKLSIKFLFFLFIFLSIYFVFAAGEK